jgi:hypothetical protein
VLILLASYVRASPIRVKTVTSQTVGTQSHVAGVACENEILIRSVPFLLSLAIFMMEELSPLTS